MTSSVASTPNHRLGPVSSTINSTLPVNAAVVAFYRKLGYAQDETISLGKRLIPDS